MDKEAIKRTATCTNDEHGIYSVRSPLFDRLLGASDIEGEAWMRFYELLDEYYEAHLDGTLVEYKKAASVLGAKGRAVNSEAQRKAAVENGKKGGRPRTKIKAKAKSLQRQSKAV